MGLYPAYCFAVESSCGGPKAFKEFVKAAHRARIGLVFDVVYNHFGPGDLGLWQFDGWSENDGGGIYFYNDWRRKTPWGDNRPDYGHNEVRQFIYDNAFYWLDEFQLDGMRFDMLYANRGWRQFGSRLEHPSSPIAMPTQLSLHHWRNQIKCKRAFL